MLQPKMIELENQLNCSQNHNQPILMVKFDKKIKMGERLLCAHCLENFEQESKLIGFKKALKMIEEKQQSKLDNIQELIKANQEMVESLINQIQKLKSDLNQYLDELLSYSIDWIKNLNNIGLASSSYSFLDELELLINNPKDNLINLESIIQQLKLLNNSLSAKINIKISNLKNQDLYSQCEKILSNLNFFPHLKLFDDSIKQEDQCYAFSFNVSDSLMISASGCQIKVWDFVRGILNEITTLSLHTGPITCLQFSKKNNCFLSTGFDKQICCWNQINDKEWKNSQFYKQHTDCIDCLILNKSEDQLISGGRDHSIKVWKVDFLQNQLYYLYSLDKHTNGIYSLCLNQSENTLVSTDCFQIIIWKKDNKQKWQFENQITQNLQFIGSRLYFINNQQLILATRNEVKNYISILQLENGQQFNEIVDLKLIENNQIRDVNLFPICYNKEQNLMIFKHKLNVYLIKILKDGNLEVLTEMNYSTTFIFGKLTNDGKYLIIWEEARKKFDIYELQII
ncbi:unnamed protein product [Paramecium pentaurelia]|uniref:Uncharacterized protein n=1 Tax=Paramecium pentaurelia TaxID=43138 RepID=A0A8S1WNJ6_9CILI|nr:unnamed protein product [Paramecium pentaurelia]